MKNIRICINRDVSSANESALLTAWKAETVWEECLCGSCGLIPVWVRKCARASREAVENEIYRQLDKLEGI